MKHRPAIQLRFRDIEQHERIKTAAAASDISVNEYILCAIEYAEEATKSTKQIGPVEGT